MNTVQLDGTALPKSTLRSSVSRQTHLVAGLIVLIGLALTLTVSPLWIIFMALPGLGLMLDALTGVCPMTLILRRMPWNR